MLIFKKSYFFSNRDQSKDEEKEATINSFPSTMF